MGREALNDNVISPAKLFYNWSGDEDNGGVFKYYNKETEKNVLTKVSDTEPFTFLVIGTCSTIKGFSEAEESGFWSNEVKDIKTQQLVVRTKKGVVAQGLYENIKDAIVAKGAKFSQSVYAAMKNEAGKLQIVNIQFYGSALGPWIDFCKKVKLHEVAVQVKGVNKEKKGKNTYFTPIFNAIKVSPKTDDEAGELQKELNEYLSAYLSKTVTETAAPAQPQESGTRKGNTNIDKSELAAPKNDEEETPDIVNYGSDSDEPAF